VLVVAVMVVLYAVPSRLILSAMPPLVGFACGWFCIPMHGGHDDLNSDPARLTQMSMSDC